MLLASKRPRRLFAVALSATVTAVVFVSGHILHGQASNATGGFTDSATSAGLRPRLSAAQLAALLPTRGAFTFPSPYSTQGVRLTNASDCGGADCVLPVGYSYWSNINNHADSDTMLVFVGLERRSGGAGPSLFSYNKRTTRTRNEGPLFAPDSPFSWSSGEGWYFSATRPTVLYMNDGPRMLRYDVQSHTFETVFDVSAQFGSDKYLWQMHSSNDDRVHSATLRQAGTWEMLGCVVHSEATGRAVFYPKKGSFDECQVDKSGRWLVIKENVDGLEGEDNRIIDLQTRTERVLLDSDGAAGHSDLGFGYMIAEDNYNSRPGALRLWDFALDMHGGQPATVRGQGDLVYQMSHWTVGLGHVAHGNAQAGVPINEQTACASNAHRQDLARVNEIVCFRLDGSLDTVVVAPNMTDLNAAGGGSDDYSKLPKGNIDPTGEYFIWTANAGTSRLDAFLVRVPVDEAGPSISLSPTPPSPSPNPPATPPSSSSSPSLSEPQAVRWTNLVNVSASGNWLEKTSGCSGCPDAGAVSAQRIKFGDGSVAFGAAENQTLRYIGLSSGNAGTGAADIQFALRLQNGRAEVRESGTYKSEVSFMAADSLKIAIDRGKVNYSKNGRVFYTSAVSPSYPLLVNVSLYDLRSAVSNVMIVPSS